MADADRKKFGAGLQGKGDGTGAMTDTEPEAIPANAVLKNRDVKQHSDQRGLDSRAIQTERMEPHQDNQMPGDLPPLADERDPGAEDGGAEEGGAEDGDEPDARTPAADIPPEDEP